MNRDRAGLTDIQCAKLHEMMRGKAEINMNMTTEETFQQVIEVSKKDAVTKTSRNGL